MRFDQNTGYYYNCTGIYVWVISRVGQTWLPKIENRKRKPRFFQAFTKNGGRNSGFKIGLSFPGYKILKHVMGY